MDLYADANVSERRVGSIFRVEYSSMTQRYKSLMTHLEISTFLSCWNSIFVTKGVPYLDYDNIWALERI
jgi:hypothetical protein